MFSEKRSCIKRVKTGKSVAASSVAPDLTNKIEVVAIAAAGAMPDEIANNADNRANLADIAASSLRRELILFSRLASHPWDLAAFM
jgi:hypothetical protein